MGPVIAIALGGALGSVCRYGATLGAVRLLGLDPAVGTLGVNVLGCFLIGVLASTTLAQNLLASAAVSAGFLGGLTTFSTFSLDTMRFIQFGHWGLALVNVAGNVVLGLGAAAAGLWLGRAML